MTWLSAYARLWSVLLRRRGILALALVGMLGTAASTGAFAALTGPSLKLVFTGGAAPAWLPGRLGELLRGLSPERLRLLLPLGLIAVALTRAVFVFLQTSQMSSLCLRAVQDLLEELHRKLLTLPLSYFEGRHSGEVYARLSTDLGHVERALTQGLTYGLRDAFQLTALIWVSIWLDFRLFLFGCLTLPIGFFAIARFSRALRSVSGRLQDTQAKLLARAQEIFTGVTVLQMYRAEGQALRAEARAEEGFLGDARRSAALRAAVTPTVEVLAFGAFALILAGLTRSRANFPPEKILSFLGAVLLAYQPLKSVSTSSQWTVPGLTAAQRLFRFLDSPVAISDRPGSRPLSRAPGPSPIAFEAVTVRYGDRAALSSFSLRVEPGEGIAIVGRSGAGKSTLLHLLPRLLDPTLGRVLIHGQDVASVTLSSLRAQIALVGQDVFLFASSVEGNVRAGAGDASRADVEAALEAAEALAFVRELPEGLDTRLGERGLSLSGGQRQRLSIARALLKRAPILLLDEALSAVDPPLEARLLENLRRASRGATVLFVTHRLQTAQKLDRVVVVDRGGLLEEGPPSELLATDGWFARAARESQGLSGAEPEVAG